MMLTPEEIEAVVATITYPGYTFTYGYDRVLVHNDKIRDATQPDKVFWSDIPGHQTGQWIPVYGLWNTPADLIDDVFYRLKFLIDHEIGEWFRVNGVAVYQGPHPLY
jgi:hypothetical protein